MKAPTVHAAGGIVCRITTSNEVEVLLVGGTHREPDHWSFPKGRQNPGEPIEMTALREVREETGLDVELIALVGINAYKFASAEYGTLRDKTVRLFLARVIGGDVGDRDAERLDVRWLPLGEAHRRLKYPRDRELLIDAQQLLKNHPYYRELLAGET
jgi:8-oxo-dGTP pyrophosphatase MutT (NUDIX family)